MPQSFTKIVGSIEKRIIESGSKMFSKILRRNLKSGSYVGSIVNGSRIAVRELDKANLLADKFREIFISDNDGIPVFRAQISEPIPRG